MIDHRIPLQTRAPNVVNALAQGARAATLEAGLKEDRELRKLYAAFGPRIMAGDRGALSELAAIDPMLASRFEQMAYAKSRRGGSGPAVPKFNAGNAFAGMLNAAAATEAPAAAQNAITAPTEQPTNALSFGSGGSGSPVGQLLPAGKSSSGPQVNAFSETLGSPLAQRFEGPAAPHTATAQLSLSPSDAAISGAGQGGIQAAQPRTAPGMTVAGDNVPVQEGEFAVIEAMTPEQVEQIVASPETQAEVRKHPDKRSFLKGQVQEIAAGVESGQIPPQHFRQYVAVAQQVADIMYEDAPKQLNAALIQRAKLAGLVPQSQGGDGRFEIFMANNGNMPDPKSMMEIRDPTTGNIIFSERPADQGGQNDPLGVASPESMIYNIDAILNDPALDFSTGWLQFMQGVPGTDARRFGARTKQLDGKAFLRAFDMLKGGGHITEIEGRKATEAIGRLDSGQKAEDYRGALMELRAILSMGLDRQAGLAQHREITARAGGLQTPEAIVGMTPEQIRGLNLVDIPVGQLKGLSDAQWDAIEALAQ